MSLRWVRAINVILRTVQLMKCCYFSIYHFQNYRKARMNSAQERTQGNGTLVRSPSFRNIWPFWSCATGPFRCLNVPFRGILGHFAAWWQQLTARVAPLPLFGAPGSVTELLWHSVMEATGAIWMLEEPLHGVRGFLWLERTCSRREGAFRSVRVPSVA